MGLTTKHIYFASDRKRFRIRYDKIVAFEPYEDGFGIMRYAQTSKPQAFRTGDGWFPYWYTHGVLIIAWICEKDLDGRAKTERQKMLASFREKTVR